MAQSIPLDPPPTHIACAVRGRPESRATVTRAIDLALEHGARLTFFHASDAEFLEHATIGPLSVVYNELHEMRVFTMLILVDRAQRRGVAQVDYVLCEGDFRKQLLAFVVETDAEWLVMGRPASEAGPSPVYGADRPTFTPKAFDELVADLEREGNLRVLVVEADSEGEAGA
ncbi:MAG: universal stress protein [Anaerolineae bacterium]|nr:universal stress protein [Anaerolineae bacterium]